MLLGIAVVISVVVLFLVGLSVFGHLMRKRAVRRFKKDLASFRSQAIIAETHSANQARTDPEKDSSLKKEK